MIRAAAIYLLTLLLLPVSAQADDAFAKERKARDAIVRVLERLADEATDKGDVLAAQALGETCLHVSGVPHPDEDGLREAVIDGIPGSTDELTWLVQQWPALSKHVDVLLASSRDWDVLDGRLVQQLPLVLPYVRELNEARIAMGLRGMRYDAKRSIENIRLAREAVQSDTREDKIRHGTRTVIPVAPDMATQQFLNDPALRLGLFDPGDKGITFGIWPRKVGPPDPRYKVEPPWRHRLAASCIGWSGNRNNLWRGPREPAVYPPVTKPLHLWESRMQEQTPLPSLTPMPISLHGFGPMPAEGATIEVQRSHGSNPRLEGPAIQGRVTRLGTDGNWTLVFRFQLEVEPVRDYRFVARTKDGRVLKRWTMRTTSGKG